MSVRKPKRKGGAKGPRKTEGYYVYCIGEKETLASHEQGNITPLYKDAPPPIEPADTRFGIICGEGLSAVTSLVPLADYGEDALKERMMDATWIAVRAMRHEKVVEHFARQANVVPLRFGSIYLECENVEMMLAEKKDELFAILERLRGREEWGLNVYYERAKLLEKIATLSPILREMGESAETATPGQSYLIRKKIDAMRETEAREETKRVAAKIVQELSNQCEDVRRLRVLKDEAGEHGELAAKFAFLVDRDGFEEFRSAAERLAEEYDAAGFRLELTGPWPPYNFANG